MYRVKKINDVSGFCEFLKNELKQQRQEEE